MELIREILLFFKIVQIEDNTQRVKNGLKRLGGGFKNAYRLNPFNPVSYFLIPFIYLFISGKCIIDNIEFDNPFKWN
jgi:hypothetical protein